MRHQSSKFFLLSLLILFQSLLYANGSLEVVEIYSEMKSESHVNSFIEFTPNKSTNFSSSAFSNSPIYANGTPFISESETNAITFSISLNVPGRVYYVIGDASAELPSVEQIINGLDANNNPSLGSGQVEIGNEFEVLNRKIDGLEDGKSYAIFFLSEDNVGNIGEVIQRFAETQIDFETRVVLQSTTPFPFETEVPIDGLFELYFADEVVPNQGNIAVYTKIDNQLAFSIAANNVITEGFSARFSLPEDLSPLTEYYVLIDSAAFRSKFNIGKVFKGINNPEEWSFTTNDGTDTRPPKFVNNSPQFNEIGFDFFNATIALDEPGEVYFIVEENYQGTPSAEQVINGLDFNSLPALAAGVITFDEAFTFQNILVESLEEGKDYYLYLVTSDLLQNTGFVEQFFVTTQLDLSTKIVLNNQLPYPFSSEVSVNSFFQLAFSEEVLAGNGDISIFRMLDDSLTFTINVLNTNISFNTLDFNLPFPLDPFTDYYILTDSGLVVGAFDSGKTFGGITSKEDWTFTTNDGTDVFPPNFVNNTPSVRDITFNGFSFDIALSEPGKVYYTVTPPAFENPTNEQVINGLDINNNQALFAGDIVVNTKGQLITRNFDGLEEGKEYTLFLLAEDTLGNKKSYADQVFVKTLVDFSNKVVLEGTRPFNQQTEVFTGTTFNMYFSEEVKAGVGNIRIINAFTGEETVSIPADALQFDFNQLAFSLPQSLEPFTEYFVLADSGSVVSRFENKAFNGIQDEFFWRFTTNNGTDTEPPKYVLNTPFVEEVGIDFFRLQLAINEPGIVHYVVLENQSELILPSAEQVRNGLDATGNTAFINGFVDFTEADVSQSFEVLGLNEFTEYRIFLLAEDINGNFENFTFEERVRTEADFENNLFAFGFFPYTGSDGVNVNTHYSIDFSEEIQIGNGNITFYDATTQEIAAVVNIQDDSLVQVEAQTLLFKTPNDLEPLTNYLVVVDPGIVFSVNGTGEKVYQGTSEWFFTTNDGTDSQPPNLTKNTPRFSEQGINHALVEFALSEAGKLFYIVLERDKDRDFYPSTEEVVTGIFANGLSPIDRGVFEISEANSPQSFKIDELPEFTEFELYVVLEDLFGNRSEFVQSYGFSTEPDLSNKIVLFDTHPSRQEQGVMPSTFFNLRFSEEIFVSGGKFIIRNWIDDAIALEISLRDSSQVDVQGNELFILPSEPLQPDTKYYVQIAPGFITDITGAKPFGGILAKERWWFTTNDGSDIEAPFFIDGTPSLENYTGETLELRLVVNEPALVSYMLLEEPDYDNSDAPSNYQWPETFQVLEGIDPNTGQEAILFGSIEMDVNQPVTIPFTGLNPEIRYRAFVVAQDTAGNVSEYPRDAWIRDDGPRGFEVVDAMPFPGDSLVSVDGFFNLVFSEPIVVSEGSIAIITAEDDQLVYTISLQDSMFVNVEENLLFFQFPGELEPDTDYYILLDSGAISNISGTDVFEGASDKETWFFRTGTEPQPPFFVAETPEFVGVGRNSFVASVALNAPGKVYYVVAEPAPDQEFTAINVKNGRDDAGNLPFIHGHVPVDLPFDLATFTVDGLNANRFYEVFFAAEDLEGRLQPKIVRTNIRTQAALPQSPINVNAFALSSRRILLNWVDKTGSADFYLIFRKEEGSNNEPFPIGEVSRDTREFEDIDLRPDTRYEYFVIAVNSAGESEPSGFAFARTFTNVPLRPFARKASNLGINEFKANWDELPGAYGYLIQIATDTLFEELVSGYEEVIVTESSLPIGNLSANTRYYYRIIALGDDGTSSLPSNFIGVTTLSESDVCGNIDMVTDSIISATTVALKWQPVPGVENYVVRTIVPDTDFERVEIVKTAGIILFDLIPETEFIAEIVPVCNIEPLIKGDTYTHSFMSGALPDCAPISNLVVEAGVVRALLNWAANDNAEAYLVSYREKGTADWESEEVSFNNSFELNGLSPETNYEVTVSSICSFRNRHTSEVVSIEFVTEAGAIVCESPSDFDITVEGRSVTLLWGDSLEMEVQTFVKDVWVTIGQFTNSLRLNEHPVGEFRARIRQVCENGNFSAWTAALPYKVGGIAPEAPTALEASAIGRKAVLLAWEDNANNEKGFKIDRKVEGGLFRPIAFVERDQTVYTDIALKENTTYYYRVFALNDLESSSSNIAEVVTLSAPNPPMAPPYNLTVEKTTQFSIGISWEDSVTNTLGYRIAVTNEEGFERIFNTDERNRFRIGQLRPASIYTLRVQSFNEDGASAFSEAITVATSDEPVPPAKPLFTAQGVDVDKIYLSWEIDAGAGVKIERRLAVEGNVFEEIATVLDAAEFTDETGLAENTLYEYRLRAVTADGNSEFAAATQARTLASLNITVPETPIAFLAEGVSQTQINLKWENIANNARGLILERSEAGSDFYLVLDTLRARMQTYQDTGLVANSQFEYRLTAFNGAGNSESVEVEASTLNEPVPPLAPTALAAEFIGAKRAILIWNDDAVNEEGYKVIRNGIEINSELPSNTQGYLDEEELVPNTEYAYVVVAYNRDGEAASDTLKITTKGAVPSPPRNLAVTLSDQIIQATWETPLSPNGEILYGIGGKFFIGGVEVGTYLQDSIDATTFSVSIPTETQEQINSVAAIIPNIRVNASIAVAAQNQFGFSALSNKAVLSFTAAELAAGNNGRIKEVAIAAPDRLSGYFISATSTGLAWDDRSQNEDGFKIYRATVTNPFALTEIGNVAADVSEFTDENVTEGESYNYLVVATLGDEKSGNSNILSFNALGSYRNAQDFSGTEVSAALSFTDGDLGYILTGANSGNITGQVWAYQALTNTWEQKATFPGAERMYATGFYLNGIYYMGLGSDGTQHRSDFWKYDTASDTWIQLSDFTGGARAGAVSFVIDDTAYIGTGSDSDKHLKDFWKYDASTDTWTQLNNFTGVSRSGAVAFALEGKGYIATGDNGAKLNDVWEYDASTDTWTQKADFEGDLIAGASSFILDGKAYIANGDLVEENLKDAGLVAGNEGFLGVSVESVNTENRAEQLWEYNPTNDTWINTFNKFGEGRSAGVAMVINNRAYVGLGVGNDGYNRFDMVEFSPYTILTDKPETPTSLTATANTTNTEIVLNWTENATDAIEVMIERASSVSGPYTILDTLIAGTTSYSDNTLATEDAQYFYRVRSVNHRGFSPYSNVADAQIITGVEDALLAQSIQIYPNPSNGIYNLEISLPQQRELTIRVYNSVGRLIKEDQLPRESLQFMYKVDVREEASGVYLLQLSSGKGGQHTLRVVKE